MLRPRCTCARSGSFGRGRSGAFEEVEQTRAESDAALAETERGLLEDVDG